MDTYLAVVFFPIGITKEEAERCIVSWKDNGNICIGYLCPETCVAIAPLIKAMGHKPVDGSYA